MKTTLDLPEELVREMKVRAAREGRKLRDVATEIFRRGLEESAGPRAPGHRVKLPLIHSTKPVPAEKQLTPEQIDDILLKQDVGWIQEVNESAGR